jgi:hypothetical protein
MRVKDDAMARREWMKERMGGPLTADFRDAMLAELAAVQAAIPTRTSASFTCRASPFRTRASAPRSNSQEATSGRFG